MEEIRDEEVQDEAAKKQKAVNSSSGSETGSQDEAAGEQCKSSATDTKEKDQQSDDRTEKAESEESEDSANSEGSADSDSTEAADSDQEAEPAEETGKKSFFGKKKKDKRDQQIEELTDRVQRQMAEFDNFRKRSEREKASMFEVGAKSVLEKILPTVDNFERGFANLTEEQKEDAFVQGMEKVYRQLLTSLEGIGVKPIEAVGQTFDPNFHNAVMHVDDEEAGENVVVEEFQKGYLYRDSVIRHSMVKVAN
ncbi:MAG: nucleotide exchange factor GrpE [Clostridiales bacterium]|nr:nucleotide exchange factor GrpE [Clostridiales bacterium]